MTQLQPFEDAFLVLTERAIAYLPNLLAALLLIALGGILGHLLASGARHIIRHLQFEEVMGRAGWTSALNRAGVKISPSEVVVRLVFWSIFLIFLVLGVQNLGFELSAVPLWGLVELLPRILGAVLLLFVGSAIASFVSSAVGAGLAHVNFAQDQLLASLVRGLILLVTFVAAVEHLGFDISFLTATLVNLLSIFAAALAVTFAFGGRDVARNLLAGYYARERFGAGDRLRFEEGEGILVGIGTLNVEIKTDDGTLVIPNSRLIESTVFRLDPDGE